MSVICFLNYNQSQCDSNSFMSFVILYLISPKHSIKSSYFSCEGQLNCIYISLAYHQTNATNARVSLLSVNIATCPTHQILSFHILHSHCSLHLARFIKISGLHSQSFSQHSSFHASLHRSQKISSVFLEAWVILSYEIAVSQCQWKVQLAWFCPVLL